MKITLSFASKLASTTLLSLLSNIYSKCALVETFELFKDALDYGVKFIVGFILYVFFLIFIPLVFITWPLWFWLQWFLLNRLVNRWEAQLAKLVKPENWVKNRFVHQTELDALEANYKSTKYRIERFNAQKSETYPMVSEMCNRAIEQLDLNWYELRNPMQNQIAV